MEKTVNLWTDEQVALDCFLPEKPTCRAAVVILPGGGYEFRAEHEGQGFAEDTPRTCEWSAQLIRWIYDNE